MRHALGGDAAPDAAYAASRFAAVSCVWVSHVLALFFSLFFSLFFCSSSRLAGEPGRQPRARRHRGIDALHTDDTEPALFAIPPQSEVIRFPRRPASDTVAAPRRSELDARHALTTVRRAVEKTVDAQWIFGASSQIPPLGR
ncbi:MAG: hypothetical protein ACREYB_07660 [Casimicrobiaceae bacterium]